MADLEATFGLNYSAFRRSAAEVRALGVRTRDDVSGMFGKGAGSLKDYAKAFTGIGLGAGAAYKMVTGAGQAVSQYAEAFGDVAAEMRQAEMGAKAFAMSIGRDLAPVVISSNRDLGEMLKVLDEVRNNVVNFAVNMGGVLSGGITPGETAEQLDQARKANEDSIRSMAAAIAKTKEKKQIEEDNIRRQDEYMRMAGERARFEDEESAAAIRRDLAELDAKEKILGVSKETAALRARMQADLEILGLRNDSSLMPDQKAERMARLEMERANAAALAGQARGRELAEQARSAKQKVDEYAFEKRTEALRRSGHQTEADLLEMQAEEAARRREIEADVNLTLEQRRVLIAEIGRISDSAQLAYIADRSREVTEQLSRRAGGALGSSSRLLAPGLGAAAAGFFGPGGVGGGGAGQDSQRLQSELVSLSRRQVALLEKVAGKNAVAVFGR